MSPYVIDSFVAPRFATRTSGYTPVELYCIRTRLIWFGLIDWETKGAENNGEETSSSYTKRGTTGSCLSYGVYGKIDGAFKLSLYIVANI